jgi:hypothetical protein
MLQKMQATPFFSSVYFYFMPFVYHYIMNLTVINVLCKSFEEITLHQSSVVVNINYLSTAKTSWEHCRQLYIILVGRGRLVKI